MVAQYRPRTSDRQRSGLPSAGRSGYDRRVITANQGTKHPIPSAIAHRKSCLHLRSSTRFHQRRRRGRGPSAPIEVVRAQLPSHRVGPTCGDGLLGRDASLVRRGASASHGRSPTANRWQPRRPWTTCPLQAAGLPRRRSPARRGRPWWGHPINRRRPRPRPCLTSARRIRWRLPRMPGPMFRPIGRRRASAPRRTSKTRRRASVPVPACKTSPPGGSPVPPGTVAFEPMPADVNWLALRRRTCFLRSRWRRGRSGSLRLAGIRRRSQRAAIRPVNRR